jgi:hypothetical protein
LSYPKRVGVDPEQQELSLRSVMAKHILLHIVHCKAVSQLSESSLTNILAKTGVHYAGLKIAAGSFSTFAGDFVIEKKEKKNDSDQ